ncbi:MAG: rod shape-determining protein MreC [Acidobacteria bacterium]|nr:MAG: rod shape-determining protein MreC [Acidobacteriota bacterium]
MESVLGRYKNLIVLVCVLFAQVLGLAVQVKRTTDTESSRLIRIWAVDSVTPFEKVLNWMHNSSWNIWHNYFYLRGVRAENRGLKAEIERLRLEQIRLNEDAAQARRLQALFAFKEQFISQTKPAQVIGSSGSEQSRAIYIDKGESDGLKPDMAVITADGIVGKVLKVFHSTSQVLLIDDQSSGVGGILEKSRLQGIVRGTRSGEVVLEHIMSDNPVQPGEVVRTSGGDRIFPKGLPVGAVSQVASGPDLFLTIRVRPAANLSKLEEVLVVTKLVEQEPTQLESGSVRAADILAQRLPSVPDKPPAADPSKAGAGEAAKPSAPAASKPAKPAGVSNAPNTNAANPPKPDEKVPPRPQAQASPARAASPSSLTGGLTATAPSALKPATEKGPAPPPVKVVDPTPSAPKPKPAAPLANAPTPTQDGPQ